MLIFDFDKAKPPGQNMKLIGAALSLCMPFFFQTQDVIAESVTAESATVRPRNTRFRSPYGTHFEVFADRMDHQKTNGDLPTKCAFQPQEECVIKGLLPLTNYSIRLRVCDQSSSCSGYRVGEGLRTLGDGKSFYRSSTWQIHSLTYGEQHLFRPERQRIHCFCTSSVAGVFVLIIK